MLLLILDSSPWLILVCLLAGAGYTWLLYRHQDNWSKSIRYILAGLRFILVSVLAFFLLGPIIRHIENIFERPYIVFAIDNSESIQLVEDSTNISEMKSQILNVADEIASDKFETEFQSWDGKISGQQVEDLSFDHPNSNISQMLNNVRNRFEGRNLAGVVLVSDGIYNQGSSPLFYDYPFNIYGVGIGDTTSKSDVSLKSLLYNKISYQGNRFPLVAEVLSEGLSGNRFSISVRKGNEVLESREVPISNDNQLDRIEFFLEAEEQGLQRFTVEIDPLDEEFSNENNYKQAFVDVVEGKEKILFVASAPHPDIKAFRGAIESNENYEVELYIPGVNDFQEEKYDLAIFHQVPDRRGITSAVYDRLKRDGVSCLHILGSRTDLRKITSTLSVTALPGQIDNVTAEFNPGFSSFTVSDDFKDLLEELPPVSVPFGRYETGPESEVILFHKVGNVVTNKPLLVISNEGGSKTGIFTGDGFWRWRLHEYMKTQDHKGFNEIITKLVQYLSSREDRRKFKVYPLNEEFNTNETVVLETEVYNDLYERVYGNKIDLKITDENGDESNYTYVINETSTRYQLSGLAEGVYKYSASTLIGDNIEFVSGEFVVRRQQTEAVNLTADHDLLRRLATNTAGTYVGGADISGLAEEITSRDTSSVIHSRQNFLPLINLKWIFALILLLGSAEWFLRKYYGGY